MKAIVDRKRYDTETAAKLCSNAYMDHTNRYNHGNYTDLHRTKRGAYFFAHYTLWQGSDDSIEPTNEEGAQEFYERFGDARLYDDVFPGIATDA